MMAGPVAAGPGRRLAARPDGEVYANLLEDGYGGFAEYVSVPVKVQSLKPAAEQHGDEDLFARDTWRHGLVIAVHHLGDDQVLEQVQASVDPAFGGDAGCFGGGVDIKGLLAPGLVDAASGLTGQDL
jgi:hypothetical protein